MDKTQENQPRNAPKIDVMDSDLACIGVGIAAGGIMASVVLTVFIASIYWFFWG